MVFQGGYSRSGFRKGLRKANIRIRKQSNSEIWAKITIKLNKAKFPQSFLNLPD